MRFKVEGAVNINFVKLWNNKDTGRANRYTFSLYCGKTGYKGQQKPRYRNCVCYHLNSGKSLKNGVIYDPIFSIDDFELDGKTIIRWRLENWNETEKPIWNTENQQLNETEELKEIVDTSDIVKPSVETAEKKDDDLSWISHPFGEGGDKND